MSIQTLNITVDETDENTTTAVCVDVRYPDLGQDMEVTVAFSTAPGTTGGSGNHVATWVYSMD